jgi:zinc protease
MSARLTSLLLAAALVACGGSQPATSPAPTSTPGGGELPGGGPGVPAVTERQAPPASATARDIAFPKVTTVTLENGLTIDVVSQKQLPLVSAQLVIQSGSAADPKNLPGVASFVADMLKEGTRKKSAATFAEAVEYLGAHLGTGAGQETTRVNVSSLSEHFDAALALMAEAALEPRFSPQELEKLRRRTLDELKLKKDKPTWLARRELHKALYGEHPYARIDTDEATVKKMLPQHLIAYHSQYFVPNNAFLVVVGDVDADKVKASAEKLFGKWKKKDVKEPAYAAPTPPQQRQFIVVDRPASVQSQIAIGNLAIKRNDPIYVPLLVANQVLGGSAASRLFMDLREKRSLTYGAYSRVDETVDLGAFRASAAVRTPVTGEAIGAFLEHLDRIVKEPAPQDELVNAHRYLADSFPLQIETAEQVAALVADLRVYGLPANYWDDFRSAIKKVSPEQALSAARAHIRPDSAVFVVVGKAAEVVPMLQKYGPVRVVDVEGKPVRASDAPPAAAPAAAAPAAKPGASAPAPAPARPATAPAAPAADPKAPAPAAGAAPR